MEKICSYCHETKDLVKDFYVSKGKVRGECKKCTIQKNLLYAKKNKSWEKRTIDPEERRKYAREYYAMNSEKFAKYRLKFREKHPDYYSVYKRKPK